MAAAARRLVLEGAAGQVEDRPPDAARFRADLGTAADAFLEDHWRILGRDWLATAVAKHPDEAPVPPVLATSTVGGDASDVEGIPAAAVPMAWRLRDRWVWASASATAIALFVALLVAIGLQRHPGRLSVSPPSAPAQSANASPAPATAPAAPSGGPGSPPAPTPASAARGVTSGATAGPVPTTSASCPSFSDAPAASHGRGPATRTDRSAHRPGQCSHASCGPRRSGDRTCAATPAPS